VTPGFGTTHEQLCDLIGQGWYSIQTYQKNVALALGATIARISSYDNASVSMGLYTIHP
jgi:hypothetical protein